MRNLCILALALLFLSCGATKESPSASQDTDSGKIILPPDTASNKYSKIRQ